MKQYRNARIERKNAKRRNRASLWANESFVAGCACWAMTTALALVGLYFTFFA